MPPLRRAPHHMLIARTLLAGSCLCAAGAQTTAPAVALGSSAVGNPITGTVTFTFSGSAAVASISVVTQGATGLDFNQNTAAPGTCSPQTYTTGTCTVGVSFTPIAIGPRLGAVLLLNSSGTVLATAYISGTGTGAELIAQNGTLATTYYNGSSAVLTPTVDAAGDLFVVLQGSVLYKYPSGSTTAATVAGTLTGLSAAVVDGAGNIFEVSNSSASLYQVIAGTPTAIATLPGDADDDLTVDGAGNLYTTDVSTGAFYKIAATTHTVTTPNAGDGSRFYDAVSDLSGDIFAIQPQNKLEELIGTTLHVLSSTSSITNAVSLALDPAGDALVCSQSGYLWNFAPSTFTATTLTVPCYQAVAVAPDGTLYVGTAADELQSYSRAAPAFSAPTTAINTTSAEQTVIVQNIGTTTATATSLVATSPAVKGPSTTCTSSIALAPGATCILGLEFAPTAQATPQTGTITLSGNFTAFAPTITGVVSGYPYKLAYASQPPASITAGGNAGTVTVDVEDVTGAIQTTATTSVTLTVSATGYTTQTYTVAAINGVATFNLASDILTLAGTYTYAASSTGLIASSTIESVTAGPEAQIAVLPQLAYAVPGGSDTVTVTAYDTYGNPAASTDNITLTSSDTAATFSTNPVTLASGTRTSVVKFKTTGNQTVTATDTTNTAIPAAVSSAVAVGSNASFIVTSNADDNTGTCTDQSLTGATPDANCELRVALAAVNALKVTGITAAQPTIGFASTLNGKTIKLTSKLSPTANVNIVGPGPTNLTISPSASGFQFLNTTTASIAMSMSGLTISGFVNTNGNGGAWYATGTDHSTTFTNDVFSNNRSGATSGNAYQGGAVYESLGALAITGTSFTGNFCSWEGAAIFLNAGSLGTSSTPASGNIFYGNNLFASIGAGGAAIYFSGASTAYLNLNVFSGNIATSTEAGGGAIAMQASQTITVTNSLFYNNQASASGEGGAIYQGGGSLILTGDTFTANGAGDSDDGDTYGGAIYTANGVVDTFSNDTITGNEVDNGTADIHALSRGGGIYSLGTTTASLPTLNNTIVAGNVSTGYFASAATYPDIFATRAYTTCAAAYCSSASATATVDTTIQLSALGNYGGTPFGPVGAAVVPGTYAAPNGQLIMQSILPLPGSPALAATTGCTQTGTDARGYPRSITYNGNTYCDAGATQSNYSLGFVTQPANTATNAALLPPPTLQIYESGAPFGGTGGTLTLAASAGTPSLTSLATTASGLITVAPTFSAPETADTLIANILGASSTAVASATSNTFNITNATTQNPGTIWLLSANGTDSTLSDAGMPGTSGIGTPGAASTHGGIAFDSAGNAWSVASAANLLQLANSSGSAASTVTGGGLKGPSAIAVDGAGYIWTANSSGNTLSEFNNAGTAITSTAGLAAIDAPSAIVIDGSGGIWIASETGNSVTHIFGAAAPVVTPLSAATANSTLGTRP